MTQRIILIKHLCKIKSCINYTFLFTHYDDLLFGEELVIGDEEKLYELFQDIIFDNRKKMLELIESNITLEAQELLKEHLESYSLNVISATRSILEFISAIKDAKKVI